MTSAFATCVCNCAAKGDNSLWKAVECKLVAILTKFPYCVSLFLSPGERERERERERGRERGKRERRERGKKEREREREGKREREGEGEGERDRERERERETERDRESLTWRSLDEELYSLPAHFSILYSLPGDPLTRGLYS